VSKPTLKDIETAYDAVNEQYGDIPQNISTVLKKEITRRRNAGRKSTSNLSRREQNRINQQNYRKRQKELA